MISLLSLAVLASARASAVPGTQSREPEALSVTVTRTLAHPGSPFTQGLEFTADGRYLVETSGSYPPGTASFVRIVDPATGQAVRETKAGLQASGGRFIEGISQLHPPHGHWFAATFQNQVAIEYDENFAYVATHNFPYTGWGLTRNVDSSAFFATNGSEHVMTLQPKSFRLLGSKPATCYGKHVLGLNELEMVDDFLGRGRPALLGNIYQTRLVLALDPKTMQCIAVLQLNGVGDTQIGENFGFHVANGIAYNRHTHHFMITGKNWDRMFEVSLAPDPRGSKGQAASMLKSHLRAGGEWLQQENEDSRAREHRRLRLAVP